VTMKASRALAAFREKDAIGPEEIRDAARLALGHRLKRLPFEDIGEGARKLSAALMEIG